MSTIATIATQQASTAASGASPGTSGAISSLGSLSGNLSSFLKLLMTQLQNQDPTSPLDTNQFTSQLVQYASVEQQINANTSLTTLIGLTQTGDVLQSSAMLGKSVTATSDTMPLQDGAAAANFTATAALPTTIAVTDAAGYQVYSQTLTSAVGGNAWKWDGHAADGRQLPDGAYGVTVTADNVDGSASSLPFTVTGKVTGTTQSQGAVQVQLGTVSVAFANVTAVGD